MRLKVGYELEYSFPQPTPMILMLNIHYERVGDIVVPDNLMSSPTLPVRAYRDGFGNWCSRVLAPAGIVRLTADAVINDSGMPDPQPWEAKQHPVQDLPDDTLVYLLGSRYCETDRMSDIAWSLFGGTAEGWPRVMAICTFVHERITFGYHNARATRTAFEAYEERVGVCRDFAHLAVTLCRCMNIPARYCTGYLGDIGVPPDPNPMDWSAWFDVYLGGQWRTWDARHNRPRIGRILMARGRDASDVAISTTFGANMLTGFKVWTHELAE